MAKKRHWRKRAKAKEGLQSTENETVTSNGEKKLENLADRSETMKNRKGDSDGTVSSLLSTKTVAGETCLDIDCGSNKAVLYLSKMCLGSKGSCILFKGSWLTPNEFQFVSGRENAKDWKRSIRHNGSSLKLLFTKDLLKIQNLPKKTDYASDGKENDEDIVEKGKENDGDIVEKGLPEVSDIKADETGSLETDDVKSPSTDSNVTAEGGDKIDESNSSDASTSETDLDNNDETVEQKDDTDKEIQLEKVFLTCNVSSAVSLICVTHENGPYAICG